ncbi:uncharacterized protein K489DRAFT_231158 [Dissoconium aciculare CBS 342.82]|uniref:Uncharacterized protein n=1 Tax=Dissoconium aciculare CBS 342.82 TaxID=1314786 RepID=A0A6J3M5D7_9PEZI|nr:uncharacterized protein K489DRAFT_231158 [Dissoconium aciculare CBS 342.82]KAF1822052.1 hypothetical protein K489DRAFT_231158 [Dissoconium aciculare CBS 342.82]
MASSPTEHSWTEQSSVQRMEYHSSDLPPWEQNSLVQQVPKLPDGFASWSLAEREAYAVHWPTFHSDHLAAKSPSRSTSQTSSRQDSVASHREKSRHYGYRSRSEDACRTEATVVQESADFVRPHMPAPSMHPSTRTPALAPSPSQGAIVRTISSRADGQQGGSLVAYRSSGNTDIGQFEHQTCQNEFRLSSHSVNNTLAIPGTASRRPVNTSPYLASTTEYPGKRSRSSSRADSIRAQQLALSGQISHPGSQTSAPEVYGLGIDASVDAILESSSSDRGYSSPSPRYNNQMNRSSQQIRHQRQLSADYVVTDMPSPRSEWSHATSTTSRSTGSSLSPQILTSSSLTFSSRHHSPAFSTVSAFTNPDPYNPDLQPLHHSENMLTGEARDPGYWPKPNPGPPASKQHLTVATTPYKPGLPPSPSPRRPSHQHLPPLSTAPKSPSHVIHHHHHHNEQQLAALASPPMPPALSPSSPSDHKMTTWKSKLRHNLKSLFKGERTSVEGSHHSRKPEREGWREEDLVHMPHPDSIYD